MSGIYGMVSTGAKPPDEKRLVAMQSAFTHRGPASLHLRKAHVGLGQIIDASESGRTLLTNETQTLTLAFDGSISNYRDLREELLGLGHTFATRESAETILHLYEEHGADLLPFLRGPFAFALWDVEQKRLLLACDPMGQKSLAYYTDTAGVLFASAIKGLLTHPRVGGTSVFIDPTILANALSTGSLPIPHTAFQGVNILTAGHGLLWEVGASAMLFCYWQPPALAPADPHASIVEYEDGIREHLADSVRLHVADETVGMLLSGGINSSLVAAMMQQQNRVLHTYTGRFGKKDTAETARAAQVAKHLGAKHTVLTLAAPDLSEVLPDLVRHTGQPFITPLMLLAWVLSEAVRGQQPIVLTGFGGAALLGNSLPEVAARRRFRPIWQAAATFLQKTRLARHRKTQRQIEALALFSPAEVEALVGTAPTLTLPLTPLAQISAIVSALPSTHFALQQVSAAHGIEMRFPFADAGVVEAAAAIPLNLKQKPGKPLYLLYEAAHGLLPSALLTAPLPPERLPLDGWLRQQQRFVRDTLLSETARTRSLVTSAAIQPLIEAHMSDQHDNSASLLALLTLEMWYQVFL